MNNIYFLDSFLNLLSSRQPTSHVSFLRSVAVSFEFHGILLIPKVANISMS